MNGRNFSANRSIRIHHRIFTSILVLSLSWFPILPCKAHAAVAGWSATGSMTVARDSYTATLLLNGKVLVAGGASSGVALASTEIYDPATGAFTTTGSMGAARFNHIAALLPDGKVLVAGGSNSTGLLRSAELYDPASGTFTPTGLMGNIRGNPTAILLSNGKVLVIGGRGGAGGVILANVNPKIIVDPDVPLSSAELYDPATGAFSSTGSMGTAREWHVSTLLPNGKVLVAGGNNAPSNLPLAPLASTEIYDPATGAFTATGSMTAARYNPTATLLANGKVLLAGGFDGFSILSSAELYDPAAGTFSATSSMAFTVFNGTATRLPDGKILFAGGIDASFIPVPVAQLYDPVAGTFSFTNSMITARHSHFATDSRSTLLSNGSVLVAGGIGSVDLSIASAELYTPAIDNPPVWSAASMVNTNPSGLEGATLNFTIQATDADGDSVTYSQAGLPAFCTLNSGTGAVACTPVLGDAGSYPVVFHASAAGAFASPDPLSLTISIGNASDPPQASSGGGGGGCSIASRNTRSNDINATVNLLALMIPAIVMWLRRR